MSKITHGMKRFFYPLLLWILLGVILIGILITGIFTRNNPHNTDFDVDLVYLWCDGQEAAFKKRKNHYLKTEGKDLPAAVTGQNRFIQVDELKYSLRSVEKYLPWIHHIYIVTDRQVPRWLDTKHPKITIVDHSEIIPQKYLPVFNSNAIETAIHKIPGLSEHFLLANDDTFVNRPLNKNFFFKNGHPIVRVRKMGKTIGVYRLTLKYSLSLIERDFGPVSPFSQTALEPHHNIDSYLKSNYTDCARHFEKEFTETLTHRFRQSNSVQRFIVSIWSILKGRAEFKKIPPTRHLKNKPVDSIWMSNKNTNYLRLLRQNNPALFCINDVTTAKKKDRKGVKTFLENYFPWKSKFEL